MRTPGPSGPRALAVAAGLVADRCLPEPPSTVHPVALFGRAMSRVEVPLFRDSRPAGLAYAAIGTGLGVGAGLATRSTFLATELAVAGRALARAAQRVGDALDRGDLDGARQGLPALVGRDPSEFDEKEIARAVVESVAENTVDAVVAPALWALVGGAPGVFANRAADTLDSMVGHHSARYERFGWASARLDDALQWVPARLTALAVCATRPRSAHEVLHAVRTQAPAHPSPNAGVAEAAFAAALGLTLGGWNRYDDRREFRPPLGVGRPPAPEDIGRAVRLSRDVTGALAGGLGVIGVSQWWRRRR